MTMSEKLAALADLLEKKAPPAKFQLKVKDSDNLAKHNRLVKELEARKKAGENIKNPAALANWIMLQKAGRMSRKGKTEETSMNLKMNELLADIAAYIEAKEAGGLCEMCGCEITANEAVEGPKGQMLCEACANKKG